jgi:tRNA A37 threonylcarbamoyladenosine modification protein TsaB
MEQVYHGLYQNNDKAPPELIGEIAVSSLDAISLPEQAEIIICGTGWDRYQDEFALMQTKNRKITGIDTEYPHAANIARLAMFELELGSATDPAEALPQYVRNKVASKMSER